MRHYFLNSSKKQKYILALMDVMNISSAIFISYCLRIYLNNNEVSLDMVLKRMRFEQAFIVPVHMLTLYVLNLYSLKKITNPVRMSIKVVISVVMAALLISGILFFFPKYVFGRQVLLLHIIVLSFLLVLSRMVFFKISSFLKKKKGWRLSAVVKLLQFLLMNYPNRN